MSQVRIVFAAIVSCLLSYAPLYAAEVRLAWTLPTENENGTPLTDLAGCKVYWGTQSSNYAAVVDVGIVSAYTLTGLDEGTTYFITGTSCSSNGIESTFCPEIVWSAPDLTPPTITPPSGVTLSAGATGTSLLPDLTLTTFVEDNCSAPQMIALSQSLEAGIELALGEYVVTLVATDEAGNSSQESVTIAVVDDTSPTVTQPAELQAVADANDRAPVPNVVAQTVVSDNCSEAIAITVIQAPTAGTLVGIGTTEIVLTATDEAGNSASASTGFIVTPMNRAPVVAAGSDLEVTLPESSVHLAGSFTDDGRPDPSLVVLTWSKVSGPGTTTFTDPHVLTPTATFSESGQYVLRLTVDDGEIAGSDDITITVNDEPNTEPVVSAGPDKIVTLPATTTQLDGEVTDDGRPVAGTLTLEWVMVSGPEPVNFADPGAAVTALTLGAEGTYVLRLTADDGELSASDEVTIMVRPIPTPKPPTDLHVEAGLDIGKN